MVCSQPKFKKKVLHSGKNQNLIWVGQKDSGVLRKVLQSVLQYFFHQVLLLLLKYFLPVLQTTLGL